MAVEIEYPIHSEGYNNNRNFPTYQINGIDFTDFSTYGNSAWKQLMGSVSNVAAIPAIKGYLAKGELDRLNHVLSMLFINWNGAKIERGNLNNGNTKVISSTPEFLEIFQNLCIKVYENLVQLNKTLSNGKLNANNKLITGGKTYQTLPDLADLVNVLAGYIYSNLEHLNKALTNGNVTSGKLTGTSKTYQTLPDLADLINVLAGYIYSNLEHLNKELPNGNITNDKLTGTSKTYQTLPDLADLVNVLAGYIYSNLEHLNKELTKGNITSGKLTGTSKTYQTLPDLADLIGLLADYVYTQLESSKTITKGDYHNNNNQSVKNVSDLCTLLSTLCSDFNTYVYEPRNKTGAVKNSYVMSTPCGQNLSNPGLPFTSIVDGEVYDVVYYNSGNADYTISITNGASLTNLPSGCSIKVPDGETLEVDCCKNGYCELNYLRVGNVIYVRGA